VTTALLDLLHQLPGVYRGRGVDVATGEFEAAMTVRSAAAGAAVILETAVGGAEPYAELGVLARGESGAIQYVVVTSGAPFHRVFAPRGASREADCVQAVFGWGDSSDPATFREQITVRIYADGDLGLAWAWGVPGDEFAPRSEVRLTRE
jgi:hypothetical protein